MNAVALTTPVDVGLVASAITNDAVAASPAFLVIHIDVVEGGALHTVFIEQASIALVAEERARELADKVDMALLDLVDLANPKPAELASRPPVIC